MDVGNLCEENTVGKALLPPKQRKHEKKRKKNKQLMSEYISHCGGKKRKKYKSSEVQSEHMEYYDVIDTLHPTSSKTLMPFSLQSGRERAHYFSPLH